MSDLLVYLQGYLKIVLVFFHLRLLLNVKKKSRSTSIALLMVVGNEIAIDSHCYLVEYKFVMQKKPLD